MVDSVPEDAEGQSSQTVPAPLDNGNGKVVFSINLNNVLTVLHIEKHLS